MLRDLFAGILNLRLAAGGGNDLERPQDRHAGADERGVGAAETGERDLVHEISEDRRLDEEVVLRAATIGSLDELAAKEERGVGGNQQRPATEVRRHRLQKIAEIDQELRRGRQLCAEVL